MARLNFTLLLTITLCLCCWAGLEAQCQLANPSFEIPGSGGVVFGGWEQYGQTGSANPAIHGSFAAKVSGYGAGSESGFWQQLDCQPGEQWRVRGHVFIPSESSLSGSCSARVKLEWFNSEGGLINLVTNSIAGASAPTGQYLPFHLLSQPAPAGTAALRLVLAVVQDSGSQVPEILYDQITCYSTSAPTIDDVQWNDFPGGRVLEFSQRTWRVKGPGYYGPGPNNFSDSAQSVWVDGEDRLHLTIRQTGDAWHSTEVTLVDTLGYGDYIFTTVGAIDQLDLPTVLGLFLWQYSTCWDPGASWWNPYNEFDIEYSLWGTPGNQVGQYVAQPWDWPGNIFRYDLSAGALEMTSHALRWLPDRVECRAWRGGPADESPATLISNWTYTGPHIPRPEQPRVHLNLWYAGNPPSANQEVVISNFTFVPAHGNTENCDSNTTTPPTILCRNFPNPFNTKTKICFELPKSAKIVMELFDIKGRKLVTLVDESKTAGRHEVLWDAGENPSGVYFCKLLTEDGVFIHKLLLLK